MKLTNIKSICIIVLLLTNYMYGQIKYESAYYIDNDGNKVSGLIRNNDWNNNPDSFKFKENENSDEVTISIDEAREFGFNPKNRFIKATVSMDMSGYQTKTLTKEMSPNFADNTLFLRLLVDGDVKLYSYRNNNFIRFFYKYQASNITQLIYKQYNVSEFRIAENNQYKSQIYSIKECPLISRKEVSDAAYIERDLVNIFQKLNNCDDTDFKMENDTSRRDLFNLTIRPGLNFMRLNVESANGNNEISTDYDDGFRIGLELEYILPFNKNKWGIFIEPTYQAFSTEQENRSSDVSIDYQSIEVPIGFRHYMYLNDNSKIFINGAFVFDFAQDSEVSFNRSNVLDFSKSAGNLAIGLGFKYVDKVSFEFRYMAKRNVLSNFLARTSNYNGYSLIIGYTVF